MAFIGIELVAVGLARFMRVLTTAESAVKKQSKGHVEAAKTSLSYAQRQQDLARLIDLVKKAQDKNLTVHPAVLVAIEKEKRALKLLSTEMRTNRAEMVSNTAEAGKFARSLYLISFAAGIVSAALLKISQVNLKAALSVEKYYIALDVLTEYTGASTDAVAAEMKELQDLNTTRGESTQLIARLMGAQFDYTKASDIALIGIRASTLSTLSSAEATRLATDAIINMTPRQLRQLDLGERANRMFDDLADELEINAKGLTTNERRLAIYNFLLQQTIDLKGIENKLWQTGTGQLEIYNTQIKDLQTSLGEGLLPAYIDVLKVANDFLVQLNKLPKPIKDVIAYLVLLDGALAAVTASTLTLIGLIRVAGFGAFLTKIGTLIKSTAITIAPLLPILTALTAAVISFAVAIKALIELFKALKTAPIGDYTEAMQKYLKAFTKIGLLPLGVEALFTKLFVDESKKAGKDAGKAFVDSMLEEIEAQLRQIEIETTRLAEAFELEQAKATIVLVPLRLQELQIQRNIDKTQRLADAAEELAEGPLKNAQEQLKLLSDISKDLDRDLWPYEAALRRVEAAAAEILIPLRMQERSLQRQLELLERRIALERVSLENVLKAAELSLRGIEDQIYALDKALWPLEDAFAQLSANAELVLIPLRAQERSLQRQLELLERRIALERKSLENALRAAELSLRGIEDQVYALDKALWPLQDAFTQIRADADLVLIPLRRQQRAIERQIDSMTRLSEIEQERIERHLRALEQQRDALQEIIDVDRDRLELINHEIFMEQQRNRILQRVTSAGLLTMQSQSAVLQDQLDLRQEQMKALNEQTKDERERLQDVKDVLAEQLEPLKERLQILVDAITLEEDRVTFAQENLRLEEARQTASRITLEQQRRLAEEEIKQAQRRLEAFDELAEARTQALRDELLAIGDVISLEEEKIQRLRDVLDLERAGQAAARITLEQQRRLAEEEIEQARRKLEDFDELATARTKALRADLILIGDAITREEERIQIARDSLELARIAQTEDRLFLAEMITKWEDLLDKAQIHFDLVKKTYDTALEDLKKELTAVGLLITAREDELKKIGLIKDAVDATLKLEKDQLETRKKYLSVLKKIQELPLIMKNGATATPSAATIPTVPMPSPVPTPSITSQSSVVGPTIQLVAHYGKVQSIATIKDDVELMLSYAS